MARIVKEQEYNKKRNEILDSAQRFLFSKGYESMAIQDILADIQISSGAFYHYFDSKSALLEALIDRMVQQAEQVLPPIVHNPNLTALEKMQRFFSTLDNMRTAGKTFLIELLPVWYSDDNAIVRLKVGEAIIERRAPLLAHIICQGIQEKVFTTNYPDQVSKVVLSLTLSMGNALARLILLFKLKHDELGFIDDIVATYAVYTDAIERVLGVSDSFLYRIDAEAVKNWFEL